MGTLDEVQSMRKSGKSDADISSTLQEHGLSQQEISAVMSQSKIKDAVQGAPYPEQEETTAEAPSATNPGTQEYGESMSASVMSSPQAQETQEAPEQPAAEEYPNYSAQNTPQQESYQSYDYSSYQPAGVGSDVITEIADQVVAERLAPLTTNIDKIIDMRSTLDAQMRFLDERLKRIEKIIDRLQLSLLQRVGEYVSSVEDIKSEITETNKTFRSLVDRKENLDRTPRSAGKDELTEQE